MGKKSKQPRKIKPVPDYSGHIDQDEFKKVVEEIFETQPYVGLLSPEQVSEKRYVLGSFIDQLGDKIYQLPGGALCGQGGWDEFNKIMREQAGNFK